MSNDGTEPNRGKRSLAPVMLVMTAAAAAIGIIFAVVAILGAIFTAVSERGEKIVGAIYLPSDLSEGQVGILLATYGGAGLALVLGMVIHHVRTPTHRLQLALWGGVVFFCIPVAILFLPLTGQELTQSGVGFCPTRTTLTLTAARGFAAFPASTRVCANLSSNHCRGSLWRLLRLVSPYL